MDVYMVCMWTLMTCRITLSDHLLLLLLDVAITMTAQMMKQLVVATSRTCSDIFLVLQALVGSTHTFLGMRSLLLGCCP